MKEQKNQEKLIRKFMLNTSYDLKVIEEYLEEMAENGYLFVKKKGSFFYFKECEPQKLRFCVDTFPKASIFDTKPEVVTEEYIEVCEEAGWKYLWSDGKLQIFCSEQEDVVPLHTDETLQLKTIHKNLLANEGIAWLAGLIFCINCFGFQMMIDSAADVLIRNWYFVVAGIFFLVITGGDVIRYLFFYIRNRRRAKQKKTLTFYNRKHVMIYAYTKEMLSLLCLCILLYGFIKTEKVMGWITLIVMISAVLLFLIIETIRNRNKNRTRTENITIVVLTTYVMCGIIFGGSLLGIIFEPFFSKNAVNIVYYNKNEKSLKISGLWKDEIPFELAEVGSECIKQKYNSTKVDKYRSFFGEISCYSQILYDRNYDELQRLEYDVIKSDYEALLTSHMNYYEGMGFDDVTAQQAELWDAEKVLYKTSSDGELEFVSYEWLIAYEDVIFRVRMDDVVMNEEVMMTVKDKLDGLK